MRLKKDKKNLLKTFGQALVEEAMKAEILEADPSQNTIEDPDWEVGINI